MPFLELEDSRIKNVIQKLAIGHILHETGTKVWKPPLRLQYRFLQAMTAQMLDKFNDVIEDAMFPEVGSRLWQRIVEKGNTWIEIQARNYRYFINGGSVVFVRLVIKEMLFAEVVWDPI